MSRKKIKPRMILPDPKYQSVSVAKFANKMMLNGDKAKAYKILYDALEVAALEISLESSSEKMSPAVMLESILAKLRPLLKVKSRRIGGATYQVPIEVGPENGLVIAMRWFVHFSRNAKGVGMAKSLARQFVNAWKGVGEVVKKREEFHKMAESNKMFSRYATY